MAARPSRGRTAPIEVVALCLLAIANVTLPRLSRKTVVPASLATAGAGTWLARRAGASWAELGMEPVRGRRALGVGLRAAVPPVAGIGLAATTRAGRRVLVDEQAATARGVDLAYHVCLRIPFATALPEEILFRGALPAIFARRRSRAASDAIAAVLFGLWHVVDAVAQLRTHPSRGRVAGSGARRATVVGATVAVTAAAGLALARIRDHASSVLAPAVTHAFANAVGLVAGVALARRGGVT